MGRGVPSRERRKPSASASLDLAESARRGSCTLARLGEGSTSQQTARRRQAAHRALMSPLAEEKKLPPRRREETSAPYAFAIRCREGAQIRQHLPAHTVQPRVSSWAIPNSVASRTLASSIIMIHSIIATVDMLCLEITERRGYSTHSLGKSGSFFSLCRNTVPSCRRLDSTSGSKPLISLRGMS